MGVPQMFKRLGASYGRMISSVLYDEPVTITNAEGEEEEIVRTPFRSKENENERKREGMGTNEGSSRWILLDLIRMGRSLIISIST